MDRASDEFFDLTGDPNRDAAAFGPILAYSPYENVRAQSYPNTARGGTRHLKER